MGARQFGAVLAVALCAAAVVGATSGVAVDGAAGHPERVESLDRQSRDVTPDTIVMRVQVHGNGTATWEVAYRTRLDDGETTDAFESLQSDIETNSTEYSQQFVRRMSGTIDSAEDATGREMAGENFTVDAEVREFPQRYGIVAYTFQWKGFAAVSDDEVRVGDALSGLPLDEKTRLLITWPGDYETTEVRPTPDEERETAAVWNGPMEFAANEPRIVLSPPGTGTPDLPWGVVLAAVGGLAVVGAGVAGGWWLYRRRDSEPGEETDEPPEDLLSNEERVLRLLERRGGRVKQKAIVDELGWTEAKTSQVVGSLREQGKIESFRLGRENVLALAQEEP
ncbi:hypothetical protein NGM10_13290 [Halorussus salilacus]|uniref:DUF7345 domain-containing protein n=1 Tax=Halorussus salilacus TaxID=2953750 RepID=UPI0020A02D13|nr:hypothetical protein [Halorussus salilacus]USZ67696.1 hypothetical protein NGM10_13290 [Halorussus salilacus]